MRSDDMAARLVEARALVGMLRARGDHVDVARGGRFELWYPDPVGQGRGTGSVR